MAKSQSSQILSSITATSIFYTIVLFSITLEKSKAADPATNDDNCKVVWSDGGVLEQEEKWNAIDAKCLESTKFDESKLLGIPPNTTLEEFDLDDNCFVQCTYKSDGLLTADELVDKQKTASIFKGNLTADVLNKVMSIWDGCTDETEKLALSKGLTKCKMLATHDFCFTQRAMIEARLFSLQCS